MHLSTKNMIGVSILLIGLVLLATFYWRSQYLPTQTHTDVPFTPQAPDGNWSEPWKNACEETSIYMVTSFYQNDPITRDVAITRIQEILEVKNTQFGISEDESLETIAALITTLNLPWTTRLIENPSIIDLKTELAQQRPIIVPVFAPALWSEDYQSGGPDYHVVILTGYDDNSSEFIANDPGSEQGQNQRFPYESFMAAIHDLNSTNYRAGRKAVLFTQQGKGLR